MAQIGSTVALFGIESFDLCQENFIVIYCSSKLNGYLCSRCKEKEKKLPYDLGITALNGALYTQKTQLCLPQTPSVQSEHFIL